MNQLTAYLLAVIGPLSVGCAALAYLEAHRPGGDWNTNTTTTIIGMCTAASAQLVLLIKGISNGQAVAAVATKVEQIHQTQTGT